MKDIFARAATLFRPGELSGVPRPSRRILRFPSCVPLAREAASSLVRIHYSKSGAGARARCFADAGAAADRGHHVAMIADVVEQIVARGAEETAGRVLQHVTGIFRLARLAAW